ncbi:MAG TPA: GNAT family N-acetyltransferase [Gemmatimonadales bacterium]|nr:GNAT family N-acetyltransferase [Gemmatimonadales bacterium]
MDFQFREMAPQDKPRLLMFLWRQFGADSVQCLPNRFEWQFERYPGGSKIYLCFDRDRLIGQCCFLPVTLQLGSESVSAAFSIDTMVDPEYRRRGIGERFHQIRLDNFQVALSSGQSEANAQLYQKMGWRVLGRYFEYRLMRWIPKPQRPRAFLRDLVDYARFQVRSRRGTKNLRTVVSPDCPDELHNRLDRGEVGEAFIKVERGYLTWRYREHPYFKYMSIQVFRGSEWLGACVARLTSTGCCRVVDCYCPRDNFPAVLEGIARSVDAPCIEGALAGSPLREHFVAFGFRILSTQQQIMGSSKDQSIREELSRHDWLMFGGDSDNDR